MKRLALCLLVLLAASLLAHAGPSCPSTTTPCSNEPVCDRADVLLCEDWEDGNHVGWDWNGGWDSCMKIAGSGGYNSPNALRAHIAAGDAGKGPLGEKPECGYPGTMGTSASVQDAPLFMRFYVKFSPGYQFMCTNAQKLAYLRAVRGDQSVWRNMLGVQAAVGSDDLITNRCPDNARGRFVMDNGLHTQLWRYNGGGTEPLIASDKWYCVEWELKGSTPGQANGRFNIWVDDRPYMSYSGVDLKSTGDPITMMPYLSQYFGGNPSPAHPAQDVYYDQIVTARQRIGCMGGTAPPITPDPPPVDPIVTACPCANPESISFNPVEGMTTYVRMSEGGAVVPSSEANADTFLAAGTFRYKCLAARVSAPPGEGSWTVTVRDDGVDKLATCTIAGTNRACVWSGSTSPVAPLSLLALKVVGSANVIPAGEMSVGWCTEPMP